MHGPEEISGDLSEQGRGDSSASSLSAVHRLTTAEASRAGVNSYALPIWQPEEGTTYIFGQSAKESSIEASDALYWINQVLGDYVGRVNWEDIGGVVVPADIFLALVQPNGVVTEEQLENSVEISPEEFEVAVAMPDSSCRMFFGGQAVSPDLNRVKKIRVVKKETFRSRYQDYSARDVVVIDPQGNLLPPPTSLPFLPQQ